MLFVIMFIKIRLNYINLKILMFTYMYAISPNLFHASRRGVWCRVPCDALRTRSTFRVLDILPSYKGNLWSYEDRAWW